LPIFSLSKLLVSVLSFPSLFQILKKRHFSRQVKKMMPSSLNTFTGFRLCETLPSEFINLRSERGQFDVGNEKSGSISLGFVVEAKWCPPLKHVLGILYSSGVVRLWNVQNNEKRDFALYMRSASTTSINSRDNDDEEEDESDMPSLSSEGHRRALAAHITHFDFLPFTSRRKLEGSERLGYSGDFIEVPSIVFSTARSASLLMIAEVPFNFLPPTESAPSVSPLSNRSAELANTRFINGGLAYTCLARSDADVTCIRSWLVADSRSRGKNNSHAATSAHTSSSGSNDDHNRLDLVCVVVGCSNGALHIWAAGRSLNPEIPVAGRNPVASPRIVKVRSFTGGAATSSVDTLEQVQDANEHSVISSATYPLSVSVAKIGDLAHSSRIRAISSIPVKYPDVQSTSAHPTFNDSNNIFSTSSDDGTVKLWALTRTSNSSGTDSSSVSLSVEQLSVLPTDGVPVTALSGAAWPWYYGSGQDFHATLVPNSSRALLATGSREGCIAVYEIVIPNHIRNLSEPSDIHDEDEEEEEEVNRANNSNFSRQQTHNRRPGLSSSLVSRPSCRLTALAGPPVRALEPICDISISPPLIQSNSSSKNQYALAAASADGLLSIYDVIGSATIPRLIRSGEPVSDADLSSGSIPAMSLFLRSAVSSSDSKENSSSSSFMINASTATTAYDAVLKMGPEGEELRKLASIEAESEAENAIREQGGEDALLLRSRLFADVSATKRVVTALSSHALDSLSHAFLTCSFNDAARSSSSLLSPSIDNNDLDNANGLLTISEGALMACTGGGDLLVWSRNDLPTDEKSSSPSHNTNMSRNDFVSNSSTNTKNNNHQGGVKPDDDDDTLRNLDYEDNNDLVNEPPEPRAPLSRAPAMPTVETSFKDDTNKSSIHDVSTTSMNRSSPPLSFSSSQAVPRVLTQTIASRARLSEVAQTLRAVREQHKSTTISRAAKSPARSLLKIAAKDAVKSVYSLNTGKHLYSTNLDQRSGSRERLRGVSKSPVERAHRRLSRSLGVNIGVAAVIDNMSREEGGSSVFDNSYDDGRSSSRSRSNSRSTSRLKTSPSIREPSIPTLSERQAAAAAAAAAAGSSGVNDSTSGGHNSTSASSSHIIDGSFMSWAGLKGLSLNNGEGGRVVRLGGRAVPLDATVTVAASSATVTANNTFLMGDDQNTFNDVDEDGDTVPPRPRSATNLPLSPSVLHSRLSTEAHKNASRYIAPVFRSPARVSASLQRAARIEERAEALDSMSLALAAAAAAAGKGANGVPPLPVVDDHADNAASLGRTNVVAPVLGSSAAMAFEIARLEQAQFDEEGAVREALNRRRITDTVVVRTLVERARIRSLGVDLPRVANEPAPLPGERLSDAIDLPVNAQLYSDAIKSEEKWYNDDEEEEEVEEDGDEEDMFNHTNEEEEENDNLFDREERIRGKSVFLPMGGSPTTNSRRQQNHRRDAIDKSIQKNNAGGSIAATDILSWGKGLRESNSSSSTVPPFIQSSKAKMASVNESRAADVTTSATVEPTSSSTGKSNGGTRKGPTRPLLVSVNGVIQRVEK
jgi:hypothetical protein